MNPGQVAAIGLLALMMLILAVVWMRQATPLPKPRRTKPKKKAKPPPESEQETFIDVRRVSGKVRASPIKKAQKLIEHDPLTALRIIRSWINEPPPDRMVT